jgi:hypothetical protein
LELLVHIFARVTFLDLGNEEFSSGKDGREEVGDFGNHLLVHERHDSADNLHD